MSGGNIEGGRPGVDDKETGLGGKTSHGKGTGVGSDGGILRSVRRDQHGVTVGSPVRPITILRYTVGGGSRRPK